MTTASAAPRAEPKAETARPLRLAIVCSHAIQYFMPWYRDLAQHPRLQVTVLLGDEHGLSSASYDPGFGRAIQWDSPLTEGLHVQQLRNRSPHPGVGRFFGIVNPDLFSVLTRDRFDAVLILGWNYALYPMALLAARAHGLPVLLRGDSPLLPPVSGAASAPPATLRARLRQAAKALILRPYLAACAGALFVSSGNRRLLRHYGVPEQRLFFTPYAVDAARFALPPAARAAARARVRRALGLADDTPLLLFVGKLQPVKQPGRLLDAYTALRAQGVHAALALAGDGELRDELVARARALPVGSDDVHFLGFQNQSELPALYAAADVFVLPSLSETFGLVVLEAMHAGLPLCASDGVGSAEDLLRADTGLVFPRADTPALTAALAALCRDPALRARLGQGSAALVSSWTFAEATKGLIRALDMVTGVARPE